MKEIFVTDNDYETPIQSIADSLLFFKLKSVLTGRRPKPTDE